MEHGIIILHALLNRKGDVEAWVKPMIEIFKLMTRRDRWGIVAGAAILAVGYVCCVIILAIGQ